MGIINSIKDFIAPQEDDELELTEEEAKAVSAYEEPKSEAASNFVANADIVLFEPRSFDEVAEIGRHIKRKKACCINLQRMPLDSRQRLTDFLNGVVYGVDGAIKRLSDEVLLCSPKNLQVAGKIEINKEDKQDY